MIENTAEFAPFARAAFWQEPSTNPAAAPCADLAARYAQTLLAYWRDCKQAGSPEPLYIIALAANGAFTYAFLLSLFDQFDGIGEQDRLVYVFTHTDPAVLNAAAQHPKLQPFSRQGRLDFALFDPAAPGPLTLALSHQSLIPHKLAYPPVVIANGVLSGLRQDLFWVEHQQLYEAWTSPAADSASSLLYQRRPLSGAGYPDPLHADLLDHYRQSLPNCALLFPFAALQLLKFLASLQGQGLMLLCADQCLHHETELSRQGEFQPSPTLARPPLNAHALDRIIIAQGGKVWHSLSDGSASTSVLAALLGSQQPRPETQRAMHLYLGRLNPMDIHTLRASFSADAEYLSLETMLALLRSHNWDDTLFKGFFPYLRLNGLSKNQQDQWRIALARIWANHFPTQEAAEDLAFDLASLAAQMHRWRYAIDLFSHSLESKGPQVATLANIGIAHWQMGSLKQADAALRKAQTLWQQEQQENAAHYPEAETLTSASPVQDQLEELGRWQNTVQGILGQEQLRADTSPNALYLSLLGPHQAEALYLHQRSPLLARQVGVRALHSVSQARTWIEAESAAGKIPLAVMHPQFGLIGLVVLHTPPPQSRGSQNLARFYYWVSPDHQNQGFGSQAMALAQGFAKGQGIKYLLSTVHPANLKSQRALSKVGFSQLNFAFTTTPAADNLGYYLHALRPGAAPSEFESYQAFAAFIQAFAEPIELAPFEGEEELEVTRLKLSQTEETH